MTNPKDLKNTGRAYAVRGVAEKLRADLTSDEPPAWMHSFLKVQNPPAASGRRFGIGIAAFGRETARV